MNPASGQPDAIGRERLRSRFRVGAVLLSVSLLLLACSNHFGSGFAELPASRGWQPLPIGSWVLNDGLEAREMVFCPRGACAHQGFAALLTFEGDRGRAMEQALHSDPAVLARAFAQPPAGQGRTPSRTSKPRTSATGVTRFEAGGAHGLLVEITARETGKTAAAAIVYAREGETLRLAFAVAEEPVRARHDAEAAWRGPAWPGD